MYQYTYIIKNNSFSILHQLTLLDKHERCSNEPVLITSNINILWSIDQLFKQDDSWFHENLMNCKKNFANSQNFCKVAKKKALENFSKLGFTTIKKIICLLFSTQILFLFLVVLKVGWFFSKEKLDFKNISKWAVFLWHLTIIKMYYYSAYYSLHSMYNVSSHRFERGTSAF